MSLLFADIYKAIRCLRIQKGVREKDILNYVQDKAGGCLNVNNVLKTIRTLHKLVDDGILIKKGKRYKFSYKKPNDEEEEEEKEEEECEEKPADCKEPDDCEDDDDDDDDDMNRDDDEDDEEDDDDEDDDDEEDDEDENEGENQENECNDEKPPPQDEFNEGEQNKVNNENASIKPIPKKISIQNPSNEGGIKNSDVSAKTQKDSSLGPQGKSMIDQNGDGKNKGGEAIAFCARDFIDSLYQPKSKSKEREKHQKLEIFPQESMGTTEKCDTAREKNKKYRMKKSGTQQCNNRSRSPIRNIENDVFYSLKRDCMNDLCLRTISSALLQEPTVMEIDLEQDRDVIGTDIDIFHHEGPQPPKTPGSHVPGQETSSSSHEMKKTEPSIEDENEYVLRKGFQYPFPKVDEKETGLMNWHSLDGNNKVEKYKRDPSVDDERNVNDDDENVSLCSVCEKKKINS